MRVLRNFPLDRKRKGLCVETIPCCLLIIIYCVFFLLFGGLLIGAFYGPNAYKAVTTEDSYQYGFLNATEPIEGVIHSLHSWNYELYFYLTLLAKDDIISQTGFSKELTYESVKILSSNGDDEDYVERNSLSESTTRKVTCGQEEDTCNHQLIFHEMNIKYENYKVEILLSDEDPHPDELFQKKVKFTFIKGNSDFAIYELSYRYGFLTLNMLVLFAFAFALFCRQSTRVMHVEQTWTLILLFSLVFFNNPLYVLNFMLNWWVFTVINMLFKVFFFCIFLLCLLVFAHALYATDRDIKSCCSFYGWKFCLLCTVFIIASFALTYSAFHQHEDPSYLINQSIPFFDQMKYAAIIILGVYILNLAYYLARAFSIVDRMKQGRGWKLKIVFFSTVMIVGVAVIVYFGLSFFNLVNDSMTFVSYQYLLNAYVYLLAVFFLPSYHNEKKELFMVLRQHDDMENRNNFGRNEGIMDEL